ncbi:anti-sigma factor family protein [Bythopirellula goksoeyrii]|uniref:Zinc-finger domain-containing protein n=1 Tax=Bythopirellula goksoeyrii TaxID=1400387 RepID=A0A5B9QJ64_9BACT|nr:hypothetical protein [Bythopirellula goksoeyrii]QEG37620.1 hypothetical protein Pr1d_49660 [Bythopirellula goksoeyrii]
MNNPPTNHDPSRLEQIVAYLDGELSPEDEAIVQRQLADDDAFRQEVQSIDRAWGALDALPGVTVDDKFSQTTMEMVVDAAQHEVSARTIAQPIHQRNQWLAKALMAAAAAALGWLGVQLVRENPNRTLLTDLPAIEYIDIYSQFQDVAFLRKLRSELGGTPWATDLSEADLADRVQEFNEIASDTDRPQWLSSEEDEERTALRGRYNHFLAVSAKEQSRLRDLHKDVVMAEDRDQLVETLLAYQSWLNTLSASQQFELREMPLDKRVSEIVNIQLREGENNWIELSAEETRQLRLAFFEIRSRLINNMTSEERDQFNSAGVEERRYMVFRQIGPSRDEWRSKTVELLSPESKIQFEKLSLNQQQTQLRRWMRDLTERDKRERGPGKRRRFDGISQEELERYFAEELDAATRERLLAQPRERMEQQLKSLYLRGELPSDDDFRAARDRQGPPGRDRLGPGPPPRGDRDRRGPPRGGRGGPPEDRPGFGHPPRQGEDLRPRDPPPRPEGGF